MTTNFEKEFEKIYGTPLIELTNGTLCIELGDGEDKRLYIISDEMIQRTDNKLYDHLLGKMKMYPMICRELIDSVHSAYLRAWKGGERQSLREARTVTQTDSIGRQQNYPMVSQPKKKHWFNPFSWGGG